MQPSAPTIVEDLSVCSREIRLRGQLRGAVVRAFVDGRDGPIMEAAAVWPDERYALRAGAVLAPGDRVRATQTLDGQTSAASTDPATVQAQSTTTPYFVAPLVACSLIAVVDGVAPGATVEILDAAAAPLASVASPGALTVVTLPRTVNSQEVLSATADACGAGAGGGSRSLPAERMPKLAAPVLAGAQECQRILVFSNVQPGAILNLRRAGGVTFWTCPGTELHGRIDPPLVKDEVLEFWQEPPSRICELQPGEVVRTTVAGGPPGPPVVQTRPCPGSKWLRLSGLVPSATVKILADGVDLCAFEAAEATQTVDLAGFDLASGQKLTAVQGLCGVFGLPSPVPSWVTLPPSTSDLRLPERLLGCAAVVRVAGIAGASRVSVYSGVLKGRIGYVLTDGGTVDVAVSPPLIAGDTLSVGVEGCSPAGITGSVEPPPDVPPFEVIPPRARDASVEVRRLLPGCHVDVVVDGSWAGGGVSGGTAFRAPLKSALRRGQQVAVTVRLCAQLRTSPPVAVLDALAIQWTRPTPLALQNTAGHFMSGRVMAAVLWPDRALLGTEEGGLWLATPAGPAIPLSQDWPTPLVRSLARGPRGPEHIYCGTTGGLLETDVATLVPMLSWTPVGGLTGPPGGPGQIVQDLLLVGPLIFLATNAGVWWATIPPAAGAAYAWQTDPLVAALNVQSLCRGPNDSVIAYGVAPAGGRFFRGAPAGAAYAWADVTPSAPGPGPGSDARLDVVAQKMATGRVASCPADPNRVCAVVSVRVKVGGGDGEAILAMLRSDDGGQTWSIPYADATLTMFQPGGGFVDLGFQADRNIGIAVHATNRDAVLLIARRTGLLGSMDGGATWDAGAWPAVLDGTFHADGLCYAFDPTDPSGNTLLVGNDGGAFLSRDFGRSWNTDYNRTLTTLMFTNPGESIKPALSASPTIEGLVVGAFQDNGKAYLKADGEPWRELGSVGDGNSALFVTGDVEMSFGDDTDGDVKWAQWDGNQFGGEVRLKPDGYAGPFEPCMARIPYPQRKDASGALMIAVACDNDNSGRVRGLFDRGAGHDPGAERFFWTLIGEAPAANLYAIASFSGQIVVAGGIKGAGDAAAPAIYLLDPATGGVVEAALPPGASANTPRWISLHDETAGFALHASDVWRTTDLMTWTQVPHALGGAVDVLAVDPGADPVRVIVAGSDGVWTSRDYGATWDATGGNPKHPQANHLDVVAYPSGRRVAHLGTWNWSLWRAELT
jgi:hypothetical protein